MRYALILALLLNANLAQAVDEPEEVQMDEDMQREADDFAMAQAE